jgi:Family of unknown function (DUF6011)
MRPEVPRGRPGKETAPSDTTSPILATRQALDEARLVAQVQELLGVVRCRTCHRPPSALKSILAGLGPTCRRKAAQKRSGDVS